MEGIPLRKLFRKAKSLVRRLRPAPPKPPNENVKSRELHLGCGHIHIEGYCNVDILALPTVDLVDDVKKLNKFPHNYADSIYACHVLEHFTHSEIIPILERWFEVLKPGGEIRISVPDIDRIVKIYLENWAHFQTTGNTPWIGLLYGGQGDPYDFHKTGFNFCWLSKLLTDVGFEEVAEYPHEPHFISGLQDASLAKEPFGIYLSLNIRGRKPR
jgi:SAM-dependent methyltransferase